MCGALSRCVPFGFCVFCVLSLVRPPKILEPAIAMALAVKARHNQLELRADVGLINMGNGQEPKPEARSHHAT